VVPKRFRGSMSGSHAVTDDWMARLPGEKNDLYESVVRRWEAGYAMLSVALNEAFALRARSELVRARQQLGISSDLMDLLAAPLVYALESMEKHAARCGIHPPVVPLSPSFFRGTTGHRVASRHALLHNVLPGERFRFNLKLRALSRGIRELAVEFCDAAMSLLDGTSTNPSACWTELDSLHYDMNTCLRETVVVLKSFLCMLPSKELQAVRECLTRPAPPLPRGPHSSPAHVTT
jgi:hypothetical protein